MRYTSKGYNAAAAAAADSMIAGPKAPPGLATATAAAAKVKGATAVGLGWWKRVS